MSEHQLNSADNAIHKAMAALERGDYASFERQLNEIDRLSHYANCFPTWRGMLNITHIMRTMSTQILQDNHLKEKPKFNLEPLR
jgi:hypothetical protein